MYSAQAAEYTPVSMLTTPMAGARPVRYEVIDVHTHFGPLVLGEAYEGAYDTAQVLAKLKAFGVSKVCNAELIWDEALPRMLVKLGEYRQDILTLPSVDLAGFERPDFPDAVRRAFATYQAMGIRGIKLWKDITLYRRDSQGNQIRLDDPRLACIFDLAAAYGLFVLIHIGDPRAFFTPVDERNEQYASLVQNPEWAFHGQAFSFEEHIRMQENMLACHSKTTFVIAHVGSCAEDLGIVASQMDRYPNMYIDLAARINELGRQPYTARKFFLDHADRILFGTDFIADQDPGEVYPYYFRFLETFDEYFPYAPPGEENGSGSWRIYGIGLPPEVLRKVYAENAKRLLGIA